MASCWKPTHSSFTFVVLFVLTVEGVSAEGTNSSVVQKDGQFDTSYFDTVTSEVQIIYTFHHTVTRNKVSSRQHDSHVRPDITTVIMSP